MAQFDIGAHLSNSVTLEWLALPDAGESPEEVEQQVRTAARKKFGHIVDRASWVHQVVGNDFVFVRMHAPAGASVQS